MIRFLLTWTLSVFLSLNILYAQEPVPGAVYQGMAGAGSAYDGIRNFMFNPALGALGDESQVSIGSSLPQGLTALSQFYAAGQFTSGKGKLGAFITSRGLEEFNRVQFGANYAFRITQNVSAFAEVGSWYGQRRSDATRPIEVTSRAGLTAQFSSLTLSAIAWNPFTYNPEGAPYIFRGVSIGAGFWFNEMFWAGTDFLLIESYPGAYNLDAQYNVNVAILYKIHETVAMFAGYNLAENKWGFGASLQIEDWAIQVGASNQPLLGFTPEISLVHEF